MARGTFYLLALKVVTVAYEKLGGLQEVPNMNSNLTQKLWYFANLVTDKRWFLQEGESTLYQRNMKMGFNSRLKTHQMFSVHTTPGQLENATIPGHFKFVFE